MKISTWGILLGVMSAMVPMTSQAQTEVAAVARCRAGYTFVEMPAEATFAVTACVKSLWNSTTYAYVADSTEEPQPLLDVQKSSKAKVELDVFTTSSDATTLAAALDEYFGGTVPETIEYKNSSRYFQGAKVAIDTNTDLTVQALPDRGDDSSDSDTGSGSRTKVKVIYTFDADTQHLYFLTLTSKRTGPTVKQTQYMGRTVSVVAND